RLPAAPGLRTVEAFLLPGALPALLDALRLVERLHRSIVVPRALSVRLRAPDARTRTVRRRPRRRRTVSSLLAPLRLVRLALRAFRSLGLRLARLGGAVLC